MKRFGTPILEKAKMVPINIVWIDFMQVFQSQDEQINKILHTISIHIMLTGDENKEHISTRGHKLIKY